jgi:R.Pab1 restriction endonuclease
MHTNDKTKRGGAESAKSRRGFFAPRFSAFSAPLRFTPSVFIRVHPWLLAFFVIGFAFHAVCADADYKLVLVSTATNAVRVRLPLTDVTGKVRVKEKSSDGFGLPVAPSKVSLGEKHYLEWQIGYDIPNTNSPSVVPEIKFLRNGETKYGHELSKIIFEAVRLGLLSTNDLVQEIEALKKIPATEFEENQPVQVEVATNATTDGFQSAIQRLPQFTKTTPHGWVQIQLKQKQHAVGYQAMVYVCLPMNEVLVPDGSPRKAGPAKSKETVSYDFTRANAAFLLDIIHAFGLASRQHNEDMAHILGKILETSASR